MFAKRQYFFSWICQRKRSFKHHLTLGTDLWMKGFFRKRVKRVKRCSTHPDSSADVISQCHVHSACVVTAVPQGLEVDCGERNLKCWQSLSVDKWGLRCCIFFWTVSRRFLSATTISDWFYKFTHTYTWTICWYGYGHILILDNLYYDCIISPPVCDAPR